MGCPDVKTCPIASGKKTCSHWLPFQIVERTQAGEVARVREDCAINWLPIFMYDNNVKLEGIQKPTEQTRNLLNDAMNKTKRIAR